MLVAMLLALEDLYFAGRKDGEQYNGAAASLACQEDDLATVNL